MHQYYELIMYQTIQRRARIVLSPQCCALWHCRTRMGEAGVGSGASPVNGKAAQRLPWSGSRVLNPVLLMLASFPALQ